MNPRLVIARAHAALKPYLVPYYLTLAAVLGGLTVGFLVLTLVIVLIATNFNLLGFIE